MAKRKIEIFEEIHNEKEFDNVLRANPNVPICAEIYSNFTGPCTALDRLFTTIKLDWSGGMLKLLKVPADEIEALERFRNQSEPVFMFIFNGKVTKVFRGVNSLALAEVAKKELSYWKNNLAGVTLDRPMYELNEATPDEMEWIAKRAAEKTQERSCAAAKRASRQVDRKRHRAELMVPHLQTLNFVLFWPHCFHAHPELYEKWDANNVIMVGREEIELTEEKARDVLYSGDAPLNEASLQKLLSGPALAICFRLLDTDKHFVTLIRRILYEELPEYDENKSAEEQLPRMTAFDYYKTFSPSREEVQLQRREAKMKRREEELKQRARRLSEMKRMARQAIEDAIEAKKTQKENRRMELLKTGNLTALKKLDEESDDDDVDMEIPEELPDEYVEEPVSEEDEDEYFPPAGLLIPGFYAPPNDVAKVNGLAVLFPKIVSDYVTPEPEFLPPHILVMLEISKRHKAIDAIAKHKNAIIHMGIFKASSPYDGVHTAYSVKQYDASADSTNPEEIKLVFMLSIKTDFALLALMDLYPLHVSRDAVEGEEECASMFPLNYGDDYDELEDFNTYRDE